MSWSCGACSLCRPISVLKMNMSQLGPTYIRSVISTFGNEHFNTLRGSNPNQFVKKVIFIDVVEDLVRKVNKTEEPHCQNIVLVDSDDRVCSLNVRSHIWTNNVKFENNPNLDICNTMSSAKAKALPAF